jgi:hypothetical protein
MHRTRVTVHEYQLGLKEKPQPSDYCNTVKPIQATPQLPTPILTVVEVPQINNVIMLHSTCSDLESILTCFGLCVRWQMGTVHTQSCLVLVSMSSASVGRYGGSGTLSFTSVQLSVCNWSTNIICMDRNAERTVMSGKGEMRTRHFRGPFNYSECYKDSEMKFSALL